MSSDALDAAILAVVHERWRKVAFVIGRLLTTIDGLSEEQIAQRIYALVEAGRLEGAGDLKKWRYSEVRLPDRIQTR